MSTFINDITQADHAGQATPATVESFALGECPFDATVTEAEIVPSGPITGDNTNNRTFTLQNRGQAGAGTTVIATLQTNVAGGSWVANDSILMVLSGTATNLQVALGDVLAVNETVAGAGVAHPAFQVTVRGTRR